MPFHLTAEGAITTISAEHEQAIEATQVVASRDEWDRSAGTSRLVSRNYAVSAAIGTLVHPTYVPAGSWCAWRSLKILECRVRQVLHTPAANRHPWIAGPRYRCGSV